MTGGPCDPHTSISWATFFLLDCLLNHVEVAWNFTMNLLAVALTQSLDLARHNTSFIVRAVLGSHVLASDPGSPQVV